MTEHPKPKWIMRYNARSNCIWQFTTAPCWFHRVTQRPVLGICWERKDR